MQRASYMATQDQLPSFLRIPTWRSKQLCEKVVKIFSGILEEELWLKPSQVGYTDGRKVVGVPFHDPECYLVTTHEISHIYFGSDPLAAEIFCKEIAERFLARFRSSGSPYYSIPGIGKKIEGLVFMLANVLDDERVLYLWSRIYPGDGDCLKDRWHRITDLLIDQASEDFFRYTMSVARGLGDRVPNPRAEFVAARPIIEQTLLKVRGTDYKGCLVATRFLVERILNALLDDLDQAQSGSSGQQGAKGNATSRQLASSALEEGDEDGSMAGAQGGPGDAQDGDEEPQQGQKPSGPADDEERRLANMLGALANLTNAEDNEDHQEAYGDTKPSDFNRRNRQLLGKSHAISDQALDTGHLDSNVVNAALSVGSEDMDARVERARSFVQHLETDAWLTADSRCKVNLQDVTEKDLGGAVELTSMEQAVARRLRVQFIKILGRKRAMLDDFGDEVDIQALIDHKLDRNVTDVFECEESGAGFYGLILTDMSGSMRGNPYHEVERAEQILREALQFPFVEIERWGFSQKEKGQCDLFRFPPKATRSASTLAGAWGTTPLHEAVRVAGRQCLLQNKLRRLFVLTDGAPCYTDFGGNHVATEPLVRLTGTNIRNIRRNHVGVYGLAVGGYLNDETARQMFGERRYWRRAEKGKDLTEALVELVQEQFREYLAKHH